MAATTILPRDNDHVATATQFGQYQLIHSAHKQAHQASVEEWVKTKKRAPKGPTLTLMSLTGSTEVGDRRRANSHESDVSESGSISTGNSERSTGDKDRTST